MNHRYEYLRRCPARSAVLVARALGHVDSIGQLKVFLYVINLLKSCDFIFQARVVVVEGTGISPQPEPEPEPELKIPSVLKQIAGDWANGLISDYEFLQQVQILINQGKLILPGVDTGGPVAQFGII